MNKLFALSIAGLMLVSACKKDEETKTNDTTPNPIEGLVVLERTNVLVVENTGAWCQYCPNGAEMMIQMHKAYDYVVPVAVHNADPLTTPTASAWEAAFPAPGYPSIHVNGKLVESLSISSLESEVLSASATLPTMGVAHKTTKNDTAILVDVKVEVFEDMSNRNFVIQSYLLLDGVLAKDYGTFDLRQTSSLPFVDKGPSGGFSRWTQDRALVNNEPQVKANDPYLHYDNVWSTAMGDTLHSVAGTNLGLVNPFGVDYVRGDVFGTRYTPLHFWFELPTLNDPVAQALDFTGYKVLTVITELVEDGGAIKALYVNSYMSEVAK